MPFIPTLTTPVGAGNTGAGVRGGGFTRAGNTEVPKVWQRPHDRSAAAARVEALSLGGMDDHEIPAFLRRQAD